MLDSRQYLASTARFMTETILRTVAHTPADKLDWIPMGKARSTRDLLQECAESLERMTSFMSTGERQALSPKARAERAKQLQENPPALADLEQRLESATDAYAKAIEAFPEGRWMEMGTMPLAGQPMPLSKMLGLPALNLVYHWGQINYIQLMLGDEEMHGGRWNPGFILAEE